MTNEIQPVHTPCKSCVFAEYEGITQNNCFLGYLDKYKKMGVEILEVYDQQKEFYVLNNKKCIGYRENKWFSQFGLDKASIEAKAQKYLENEYIRYMAVIDLKTISLTQMKDICKELSSSSIKPQKIIIIRYLDNKDFKYSDIEQCLKDTGIGCAWRVQTILDNEMPHEMIMHDIVKSNKNIRFLVNIQNQNTDICNIIQYANDRVYKDLNTLMSCGNKDHSCILYSSTAYRFAIESGKDLLADTETFIEL